MIGGSVQTPITSHGWWHNKNSWAYSSSKSKHKKYYLDGGVSVSDGATVTGVKEWDVLRSGGDRANTAKLVLRLLLGDAVNDEPEKYVKFSITNQCDGTDG